MTNKPISEVIAEVKAASELIERGYRQPWGCEDSDDCIHVGTFNEEGDLCPFIETSISNWSGNEKDNEDLANYLVVANPVSVKRLIDHIAALERQLAASVVRLPDLNAALIEILGRPNFHCSPVAKCLRIGGAEIPRKSENEQAACIHWMLSLYLEHGESWRTVAQDELKRIADGMQVEGE
ncbi:hypothetical protein [Pectobacterium carotovorum]|uniref:hypothetical protein n=1 Tax=Pectobacterium carotovorum TaxID=554 RepID=UPI0020865BA5|nr:hypothetical protein [Pectobacterium carotovorum]GKV88470.1 hypothetical protein PEC301619_04520 [Pectobacterium carotovorum subsp. carotovorum]